jgi:phosphate:Na+ symporter
MKVGFDSYKEAINLADYAIDGFAGLMVFTGIGILATVILQSSSATMAVILTALAAGQITYFNSLALAIGANVGTTITAIIGAMASNAAGKRLAGAHLIFNVVTALIAIVFLNQIAWMVDISAEALNISQENYTLKLALFHTIFNVIGVVVMVPFVNKMVKFLDKNIKEQKLDVERPKYLSKSALKYHESALAALINETNHLFDHVFKIIAHGMGLHRTEVLKKDTGDDLKSITTVDIEEEYYRKIKYLYGEIIEFATRAQELHADVGYIQTIYNIKEANRYFVDAVKDVKELQPNMLKYTKSNNLAMQKEYNKLRSKIAKILRQVYKAQKIKIPPNKSEKDITELMHEHIEKRHQKFTRHLDRRRKFDVLFNGTIDKLIRDQEVTREMVSSLINDNALTTAITKHLIQAAEVLYLNTEVLMVEAEEKFVKQEGE